MQIVDLSSSITNEVISPTTTITHSYNAAVAAANVAVAIGVDAKGVAKYRYDNLGITQVHHRPSLLLSLRERPGKTPDSGSYQTKASFTYPQVLPVDGVDTLVNAECFVTINIPNGMTDAEISKFVSLAIGNLTSASVRTMVLKREPIL